MHINVHEDHRRRGIGQQMLHIAQQRYPHLRGPSDRSDDGVLWGRAMNQRPDVTRIYPDPRVTPAD
jgi:GNAT superfamily N-acetyltransferase